MPEHLVRYYPTYQSLTDQELRGYFSWRTQLRHGKLPRAPLSFAYLYIYELLNQIGCSGPPDALQKLRDFREQYGAVDAAVCGNLDEWIRDFVIYYDMDPALLPSSPLTETEAALYVLTQMQQHSEEDIMKAVLSLSSYRLEKSRFYRLHPQEMTRVICRVLSGIKAHYDAGCKKTWIEEYFGFYTSTPVYLFETAVFYDKEPSPAADYLIGPFRKYHNENGRWTLSYFDTGRMQKHKLGDLLRTLDSMMREVYAFAHPIKPVLTTKWLLRVIQEQIQLLREEEKRTEQKKLRLDLSSLAHIRKDASYTMDKLITEEEAETRFRTEANLAELTETNLTELTGPDLAKRAEEAAAADSLSLDPEEAQYLSCLLYGRDTSWLRSKGLLPSVLTDRINERLFDLFNDMVLDGDCVIDDYIDELKEMIPE